MLPIRTKPDARSGGRGSRGVQTDGCGRTQSTPNNENVSVVRPRRRHSPSGLRHASVKAARRFPGKAHRAILDDRRE